jgi:hypothetical protein
MDRSQSWAHLLCSSLPLLYIPAGAAAVSFAVVGRLIGGRPSIGRHVGDVEVRN